MTTPALTAAVAIVTPDSNAPTVVTPITFLYDPSTPTILTYTPSGLPPVKVSTNKWEPATFPQYSWNNIETRLYWRANQGGLSTVISVVTTGLPADATPQTPITISGSTPTATPTIMSTPTPTIAVESSPLATTATSTTVATTSSSPTNSGLAVGAIAGIAAGSFVAGALIAALLTWCMTKKKKPSKTSDSEASTVLLVDREKANDAKTISISSSSPMLYASEGVVTQPLEDKAISGEVSKISNLIKNHVQSYYHGKNVSAGMIDYDDLHALGPGLPVSVGTLGTLLANSKTREIALRFCIAWVVTSRTQLHESSHRSFLPLEVSECLQVMSPESWDSKVHSSLLTKWRVITAELMQAAYVRSAFSLDDNRIHNIQVAAGVLENVLRPYIDTRMDNGQRSRNLEEILKRAAQFAFTLFSQSSEWDFDWHDSQPSESSGSLCVFPALVQLSEEGEPMKPPRPFSEAVVRRLDE